MNINLLTPKYFALNCKYIVPRLTYEDYLLEVVNSSMFFRSKCNHLEQYRLEIEQSHGENDVVSSQYCMDFKLLVDQETMNTMSKNRPEVDYTKMSQGFIIVKTKTDEPPIPSQNILFDLITLKAEDLQAGNVSETVSRLIKNLKKDKNLFIYYPYEFFSEEDVIPIAFEKILTVALDTLMNYRIEEHPDRDTYICIKANHDFLIYEWYGNQFVYRDKVPDVLCGTYRDVKLYSVY